jgi:hypothetical protein
LDGDTEALKDLLKLLIGFPAVALCVWLYLRLSLFFFERGRTVRRSPRLEIQTLFRGNTKVDKDQV